MERISKKNTRKMYTFQDKKIEYGTYAKETKNVSIYVPK